VDASGSSDAAVWTHRCRRPSASNPWIASPARTPFESWHEVESLRLVTERPIATIHREFVLDGIACRATHRASATCLCDTLIGVKVSETRNLTLNLPESLLRRFRIYAATHDQSMTQLITIAIQRMLAEEDNWETSKRRLIDRMAKAKDRVPTA